jgi:hypothetical protein
MQLWDKWLNRIDLAGCENMVKCTKGGQIHEYRKYLGKTVAIVRAEPTPKNHRPIIGLCAQVGYETVVNLVKCRVMKKSSAESNENDGRSFQDDGNLRH